MTMSYITLEVKIENGRIIPNEPEKVPQTGAALLTILQPNLVESGKSLLEMNSLAADTWEKLGPAPEIDYDKL